MPWKGGKVAPPPIEIEFAGIVTWVRGSPLNAPLSINFGLPVKLTAVRAVHCLKAVKPIEVTAGGIVTEARELHCWKAFCEIEFTDKGIATDNREVH